MLRDDWDIWSRIYYRRRHNYGESNYPTVYTVDEFEESGRQETIRQILNGQSVYYGLAAEFEPTPEEKIGVRQRMRQQRRDDEILIERLRDTWRALKR